MKFILTPCLWLCSAITLFVGSATAQVNPVSVIEVQGRWQLLRNGQPYYVIGAGGETHLNELVEIGGNSIRTWGSENAQTVLDEAHKRGLTVLLGLWVQHERHGFDYNDTLAVAKQLASFKATIDQFKNHPALLMWGIGNEVNLSYSNPKVWNAIQDIANYAHQVDPNHPTTTVTAGLNRAEVEYVKQRAPDIDIFSVNTYGDIAEVPKNMANFGWAGPYMITEWGPNGHWESPTTKWGAAIEQSSWEKASVYTERYQKYIEPYKSHCVGSYVFLWGQKQEYTETWYGLFTKDGLKTQAIDALNWVWKKDSLPWATPSIQALSINKLQAKDNISLKPNSKNEAIALGQLIQYHSILSMNPSDFQNTKLQYEWKILKESTDKKSGGDAEKEAEQLNGLIPASQTAKITFRAPAEPGAYRLFVRIQHHQTVAYANLPFQVLSQP